MNVRFAILLAALTARLFADGGQLDALLKNSPFGAPRAVTAPVDPSGQPFEFRGSVEENGVRWFSVFDTASKRSLWRKLGDNDDKLAIKQYDPASNTLTVEHQSRTLSLTLRSAPRIDGSPIMPQPGPGQQPPVIAQGQAPATVTTGDNAQRLQQIAEEIRRRRALRQQNTQPAGTRP